jgi:hypothetical protein
MIIGLIGKKRSGKDTVAEYLVQEHGYKRYGFADPMKEMLKEAFLWNEESVNGRYKEIVDPRWGISPRQALQHIGTEWAQIGLSESFPKFKELTGRNLWVKRFIFLTMESDPNTNWVISDVRFPHEISLLKGSIVLSHIKKVFIRVRRPEAESIKDKHESEKYTNELECDYEIWNDKSIEDLYATVSNILFTGVE